MHKKSIMKLLDSFCGFSDFRASKKDPATKASFSKAAVSFQTELKGNAAIKYLISDNQIQLL